MSDGNNKRKCPDSDEGQDQEQEQRRECPICLEEFYPPIMQCKNGHVCCEACLLLMKPPKCGECRVSMNSVQRSRCLVLESLMADGTRQCRRGCEAVVSFGEILAHERTCNALFYCPSKQCKSFRGTEDEIYQHLKMAHKCQEFPTNAILWKSSAGSNMTILTRPGGIRYLLVRNSFGTGAKYQEILLYRIYHAKDKSQYRPITMCMGRITNRIVRVTFHEGTTSTGLDVNPHRVDATRENCLVVKSAQAHLYNEHFAASYPGNQEHFGVYFLF